MWCLSLVSSGSVIQKAARSSFNVKKDIGSGARTQKVMSKQGMIIPVILLCGIAVRTKSTTTRLWIDSGSRVR